MGGGGGKEACTFLFTGDVMKSYVTLNYDLDTDPTFIAIKLMPFTNDVTSLSLTAADVIESMMIDIENEIITTTFWSNNNGYYKHHHCRTDGAKWMRKSIATGYQWVAEQGPYVTVDTSAKTITINKGVNVGRWAYGEGDWSYRAIII